MSGKDYLIATNGPTSYATADAPLLFPSTLFKDGYYFCKTAIMGGVSEIIDANGREHRLMFAKWIALD